MPKFFSSENKQLTFILITMFLNALGFSIIIPIVPFLIGKYVTDTNHIALYFGLLVSIFALCQFFAAPGLGALSDRYGRRPILLVSLFGSAIGYLFLGIGGALWVLFLGRIIDGITGGNISTIYAYVADITEPQNRGKHFGMIGAAWGFGFMIGPAISGFLSPIGLAVPLFLAAAITLANMVWGYFVLPESLPQEHKAQKIDVSHLNPFTQFGHVFSYKEVKDLFIMGSLFFLGMNALYGNSSIFFKDVFRWTPVQIGIFLFLVGILDIFSQGYLLQKLLKRFTYQTITIIGLVIATIGFIFGSLAALNASYIFVGISLILNIGDGLFEPSFGSLISNAVGPHMQGRVQGASQGMQSVARIIGPLLASWLYTYWKGLPYAFEATLCLGAVIVLLFSIHTIKSHRIE